MSSAIGSRAFYATLSSLPTKTLPAGNLNKTHQGRSNITTRSTAYSPARVTRLVTDFQSEHRARDFSTVPLGYQNVGARCCTASERNSFTILLGRQSLAKLCVATIG